MQENKCQIFINDTATHKITNLTSSEKLSKKDRFQPYFCSSSFYQCRQKQFRLIFDSIQHFTESTRIYLWTNLLCCLRRPTDWFGGLHRFEDTTCENKRSSEEFSYFLNLYNLFHDLGLSWPHKLDRFVDIHFFARYVAIKPLPRAALRGLQGYLHGHYPLVVYKHEPSPLEVLHHQAQNQRVLSFNEDFQQWPSLRYGERDVLSFWLHDFIHADHFFFKNDHRQGQLGFYKFIYHLTRANFFSSLLNQPAFEKHFNYTISDMNSHPIHLLQTLHAHISAHDSTGQIWLELCKTADSLSYDLDSSNKSNVFDSFLSINTPYMNHEMAEIIMNYFIGFKNA